MDIRNIKIEAPKITDGRYLEAIYDLEMDLLKGYCGKIEKDLPLPPIDINSFKGQQILKNFSARVIEETAEGYESTSAVIEIFEKYGYNRDLLTKNEWQMVLNHLQNSNEEQADGLAFYMALLGYANLQISDVYDYINHLLDKKGFDDSIKVYSIQGLFEIGKYLLIKDLDLDLVNVKPYILLDRDDIEDLDLDVDKVLSYIPAFRKSSKEIHRIEDHLLWQVAYHLCISRNYLKNKPWKQTQELTDITRYSANVILGLVKYLGYLYYIGFTPESLYTLCFKKNQVNRFRQRSNY